MKTTKFLIAVIFYMVLAAVSFTAMFFGSEWFLIDNPGYEKIFNPIIKERLPFVFFSIFLTGMLVCFAALWKMLTFHKYEVKDIINLERVRLAWSFKTFKHATPVSSLRKLEEETKEAEVALLHAVQSGDKGPLTEEYADMLMCLFDSAGRAGVYPNDIFKAFETKLQKNMARQWKKNDNNTYSHVKYGDIESVSYKGPDGKVVEFTKAAKD